MKQNTMKLATVQKRRNRSVYNGKFDELRDTVKMLLNTSQTCLLIKGENGISKSHTVWNTLGKDLGLIQNRDYVYINGYSTPLALYEHLFKNRSKKVIIFDDIDTAFFDKRVRPLLKGALSSITGTRFVRWSSTRLPDNLDDSFMLEAKIIIIGNKFPNDRDWIAVVDRCIPLEFEMGYTERIDFFEELCNKNQLVNGLALTKDERLKCLNLLASVTDDDRKPTLRDLEKVMDCYIYRKLDGNIAKFDEFAKKIINSHRRVMS